MTVHNRSRATSKVRSLGRTVADQRLVISVEYERSSVTLRVAGSTSQNDASHNGLIHNKAADPMAIIYPFNSSRRSAGRSAAQPLCARTHKIIMVWALSSSAADERVDDSHKRWAILCDDVLGDNRLGVMIRKRRLIVQVVPRGIYLLRGSAAEG